MSNDNKILICLWIAFLLSMIIPMHAQRGISRGNVTFNVNSSNAFSTYAFVWGDLDDGVYTEAQKKTIRRQNYLYFKQVIQDAKLNNTCLDFPGLRLQLHLLPDDKIEVQENQLVCVVGVDKKSILDFYPKCLIRGNSAKVFDMKDGGSIDIRNIHFSGSNNFARSECYAGILRLQGDYTKVKIQDTTQIRVGFWINSLIGSKIGIKHSSSNNTARTYTISAFDSVTQILTLSSGIDFSVDSNYSDSGTILAFSWGTDVVHPDTVNRYNRFFRIDENTSYHYLIYGSIGELNFSKQAYLKLTNCKLENFANTIYCSGGWIDYHINDCYLQGDVIALTKYNGIGYGNPSTVYMNRSELARSGKQLVANAVTPYGTQNDNLLFGSGSYNHPSTRVVIQDCYIHDNLTGAFRQFSDGSEKSSPDFFASYFINCTFKNNAEYHLLTSNTHRTVIENCTFEDGQVNLCFSTDINNVSLINSNLILYSYANAQPKPDTDTVQLRLNFDKVRFLKSSRFSNDWSNNRSARTVLNFTNCDFELWPIAGYYSQKITTGNYSKVNIETANVFSRYSENYPDITSNTTKGTLLQGFLYYGHDVKLYANNIRYDTFRNSIPIIPTNRSNYVSGRICNSRLLGVEGGFSQTGSNWGLMFENVEYPYTYYSLTTAYNFKSGSNNIARITIGTTDIGSSVPSSIWITSQASTYFINDTDTLKNILWGSNVVTTTSSLQKRVWSGFSGTITLIADTTFCIAPGGNIDIDSPVCYAKGDIIKITRHPYGLIATGALDRDSVLANGTTVNFSASGNAVTASYQPGQTKVYVNSTLVGTDNMNERITGATVSGFASYFTDRFNIFFTTPPANGSYVIVERRNATQGIWKIE